MSPEDQPSQQEAATEKFPSLAEVQSVFEMILGGQESTVLRSKSNEKGVLVYEVVVSLDNGGEAEYLFQEPVIYVAFRGPDGRDDSGKKLADYVDGTWIMAEM